MNIVAILVQDLMYRWVSLGLFHRETHGGQLCTYCRFMPCESEQILLNFQHLLLNTRRIHIMNNELDRPPSAKVSVTHVIETQL